MIPPELDEQDEIFRHFAYRATRRVYIYYASIMPTVILTYIVFFPENYVVVAVLGAILIGHYILYWMTVWPVWYSGFEPDDEQ